MSSQASKLMANKQRTNGASATGKSFYIGIAVAAGIGALGTGLLKYYWRKTTVPMTYDRHRNETNPRYFEDERGAPVEEPCRICSENMDPINEDLSELPCRHIYHQTCADNFHRYDPTCLLCGRPY